MKSHRSNCKRCANIHRAYVDASSDAETVLKLLTDLLTCGRFVADMDHTLSEIGRVLDEYLQRKYVRDHYFFGRSLRQCALDQHEIRAELARLKSLL